MPFKSNTPTAALLLLTSFLLAFQAATAQHRSDTIPLNDTIIYGHELEDIRIRAFEQNRRLGSVPAAVQYIGRRALDRFSPASIVQAVNTAPGVRMEERSPGSYRFSIRGSSLRSPFGVRNVKVYFNDLPFTDPGGQTYLNQLGYYNFNSIEIIKGPGSSLYGAGTGGVLLIESLAGNETPAVSAGYTAGSFGTHNIYGAVTTGSDRLTSRASFQHQQSEGYRQQSALTRDVLSWTGSFRLDGNRQLKASFLYGDLFYETPGALTRSEYVANPKAARPGSPAFPGAVGANASIRQRSFVAGASYTQQLLPGLETRGAVYGAFTELRNPNIRGYDKSSEPHAGGRALLTWRKNFSGGALSLTGGGEWQQGFSSVSNYKNAGGNPDSLRYSDEIRNRQSLAFAQAILDIDDKSTTLPNDWTLTAGASLNWLRVRFERFNPRASGEQRRNFTNELAPRIALARNFSTVTVYAGVSKGFSPPTTSELLPTGGAINIGLNAEEGVNYDLGFRLRLPRSVYVDMNAFLFSLRNTIVQRRDAGGGDFFINAGSTRQYGIETYISHPLLQNLPRLERSLLWLSHTWHHFNYDEFTQLTADFSGNRLPGTAPHTVATGLDLISESGLQASITYYFSDKLPLNDANTEYADAYHLLSVKAGYALRLSRWKFRLSAGADNLLDQRYSLGNDINGFGGRYYNAAPGRSYFVSVAVER
ncbi:MAG TPA: TonB-dependent receptor plug domain-containing protein [Flavisolibacter sp.]|jgi:iron complex outermembrane receptor protein